MKFPEVSLFKDQLIDFLQTREGIPARDLRFVVSPYRVCPIGAHIDHQGGPVLGMTIDAWTVLAYAAVPEARIRVHSLNYGRMCEFGFPVQRENGDEAWCRYAKGAAFALQAYGKIRHGFIGAVIGALPGGGLSSSASVGLAYLSALAEVNGMQHGRMDYVELDRRLENDFLGLQNGILDQATILFGKKDHLIYIDTQQPEIRAYARTETAPAFRLLVAYSGISRELISSGFNTRVAECREAAQALARFSGSGAAAILGEVPREVFEAYRDRLPAPLRRRAAHFYTECERVEQGLLAWQRGDFVAFGKLMLRSCESSIYQYESGSPMLHDLWRIVSQAPGVWGSRFSGGGYGGCVIGLVRLKQADEAAEQILQNYVRDYPEVRDRAGVFVAGVEDGLWNSQQ